jgi:Lon protease-like protein
MFPLGTVLLPGGLLPLQIFEPRYRTLITDLLADDVTEPEFGITLIERGSETGGGEVRAGVGTVARVVHIEAVDGGRYRIVVVGTRRFRVRSWLPDDPYPLADVDDWPDENADDARLPDLVANAHARVRDIHRRSAEVGVEDPEISNDPLLATYHLAGIAPLGPADRYRLLCADSPVHRLELLDAALDDIVAMIEFRRT